jgi:RNA polymerase sigma factor (sigma-70 family)
MGTPDQENTPRSLHESLTDLHAHWEKGFAWDTEEAMASWSSSRSLLTDRVARDLSPRSDAEWLALLAAESTLDFLLEGGFSLLREVRAIRGFVITVARRRAFRLLKREQRCQPVLCAETLLVEQWRPCDYAQERELQERLRDALGQLAPQYRRVVELSAMERCPPPVIAAQMGLTLAQVYQRTARARAALLELLGLDADATAPKFRCKKAGGKCS